MNTQRVIWLPSVKEKLVQFRSIYFTPEETLDFISQLILETESLLANPVLTRNYKEESGVYKGISRILIRRFKFYFERIDNNIVILAVLFPGQK